MRWFNVLLCVAMVVAFTGMAAAECDVVARDALLAKARGDDLEPYRERYVQYLAGLVYQVGSTTGRADIDYFLKHAEGSSKEATEAFDFPIRQVQVPYGGMRLQVHSAPGGKNFTGKGIPYVEGDTITLRILAQFGGESLVLIRRPDDFLRSRAWTLTRGFSSYNPAVFVGWMRTVRNETPIEIHLA